MAEIVQKFTQWEPLRSNRWILNAGNVQPWLIKNVTLDSFVEEDEDKKKGIYTKVSFSVHNAIGYTIVPDDVILLKKLKLDFLDPTGVVVDGYDMNVEFETMKFKCDYADSGLLTHDFVFYVKNLTQFGYRADEKSEKEIIEKYKEKKKESV